MADDFKVYLCPKCKRVWEMWDDPQMLQYYSDFPKRGLVKKRCKNCAPKKPISNKV